MVPAPHPQLGFAYGITGHRSDRIVDPARVWARIDDVFTACEASLKKISGGDAYGVGRVPSRLVSAIAEGSDRIAAHAALDRGILLEVVLPFAVEEYERDFVGGAALDEFRKLLEKASSTIVLDGTEEFRPRGYEAAGMTMLDNCDILIAVWDGQVGRGRGGTREVIEEAARRGMPVIVIPPDGKGAVVHGGVGVGPKRFEDLPEESLTILPQLVAYLVGHYESAEEEEDWKRLSDMPPEPIIQNAYPWLLKLAGLGPKRKKKGAPPPEPEESAPTGPLEDAFNWWDQAAIRAAQAFRSAVIVNFAMAALAVVLAATSVLAGEFKWPFVVSEIVAIFLLMANAWHADRMRWQERWLESRQVAELLRVCGILRDVGIGRGIPSGGSGGGNGWYASAVARSCPMESVDLSHPEKVGQRLVAEVKDQADWNKSTSHKMHTAAHRIERFGEVLFAIVLAAAIGWLGLYLFAGEMATSLKYLLTAITAGLPAIATASYGVRIILDFEGIANRAHSMSVALDSNIEQWEAGEKNAASLQQFARRSTDVMLGDVAAWRLLAEGRRLTIPG